MNKTLLNYLKSNKLCFRYFGIKKKYIECIVKIVDSTIYKSKVGRKKILSTEESVLLFCYYLRRYCTLEELSLMFNISVTSAFRYVENMRSILVDLNSMTMIKLIVNAS